jgi:hydroxymethylglutaryl-CoA synthase
MPDNKVGISDIQLYIPRPHLELSRIVEERSKENPKLKPHLERAVQTTGQKGIRFPEVWEDTSTLAASAADKILRGNTELALPWLRYIVTGTESSVDHSKPVSAYVEGMLRKAGYKIPSSISSFQVQHACAGGTLALLSVSGLLHFSPVEKESGIVISTDIAHYQTESTAEITQGAGAAALLVTKNPKLLEIDIASLGFSSRDVDDFFRPLGSTTAVVKGGYSMKCYADALDDAVMDHARRLRLKPEELLRSSDMIVLHTPFRKMPLVGMKRLLERHLKLDQKGIEDFLDERSFHAGIDPVADIGNTYTCSLFLSLAFLLEKRFLELRNGIVGNG